MLSRLVALYYKCHGPRDVLCCVCYTTGREEREERIGACPRLLFIAGTDETNFPLIDYARVNWSQGLQGNT